MTDGLQLLVQLMTAAMTTEPWASWYSWPECRKGILTSCLSFAMWKPLKPTCMRQKRLVWSKLNNHLNKRSSIISISKSRASPNVQDICLSLLFGYLLIQTMLEVFFHAAHSHSVLRPFRPAHMGNHGAQVDLNHLHKIWMLHLYKTSLLHPKHCCHEVYIQGQRLQHWISPYLRILGVFWGVFVTSEKLHSLHVILQQFKFFLGKIWREEWRGGCEGGSVVLQI